MTTTKVTIEEYEALKTSAKRFKNKTMFIPVIINGKKESIEYQFAQVSRGISLVEENQTKKYDALGKLVAPGQEDLIAPLKEIIEHFEREEKSNL